MVRLRLVVKPFPDWAKTTAHVQGMPHCLLLHDNASRLTTCFFRLAVPS